jgi:hypothetical protein
MTRAPCKKCEGVLAMARMAFEAWLEKEQITMKQSLSNLRIGFAILAAAMAVGFTAPNANADDWNKRTILTVNETIQVQDAVLQPGQYVMRLLDSQSDRHVVQIFNGRENHIIATILATPKERMEPTGHTQFTFWETPAGTAKAMRAWFYPGDNIGQEFSYPKHPYQLVAMVTPPPAPPTAAVQTDTATTDTTAQETTNDTTTTEAAPPVATPEPVPTPEVDQTPPPAADQTPAPAPTPEPAPQPALPQTASPYPTLGLCGVLLLGFGALLRLKRLA